MRILLTTQPGHGHFRPLLPLARPLREAGHDVRIGTSASFAPIVEQEGFVSAALGMDWLHGDDSTFPATPSAADTLARFYAWKFVTVTAGAVARDVLALAARWRPDLIVRETSEYGGLLASQALGIRSAAVQVASPTLLSRSVLVEVAVVLDETRSRLDLTPDPERITWRDELVACFAPPALHDGADALPAGFRSFHPGPPSFDRSSRDVLADLGVGRPLVYATLGTVFSGRDLVRAFFPAVVDALSDAARDVLIAIGPTRDPRSLGDQRPGVRVESYVPQRAVLERSAVVISHGGYGTLLDAIDAAVPLIVVPFGADQFLNADAVRRLGIGVVVEEDALSAGAIRDAVDALLDPAAPQRRAIAELRDAWRALPGPAGAVEAVLGLG